MNLVFKPKCCHFQTLVRQKCRINFSKQHLTHEKLGLSFFLIRKGDIKRQICIFQNETNHKNMLLIMLKYVSIGTWRYMALYNTQDWSLNKITPIADIILTKYHHCYKICTLLFLIVKLKVLQY